MSVTRLTRNPSGASSPSYSAHASSRVMYELLPSAASLPAGAASVPGGTLVAVAAVLETRPAVTAVAATASARLLLIMDSPLWVVRGCGGVAGRSRWSIAPPGRCAVHSICARHCVPYNGDEQVCRGVGRRRARRPGGKACLREVPERIGRDASAGEPTPLPRAPVRRARVVRAARLRRHPGGRHALGR